VSTDLIAQIITLMAVIYVGWHLRRELHTVKEAVVAQKATIDAQAESMKAQSTVLQDVERLNKVMQQVVAFFDPQAQLQREQAYRDRVDRDLKVLEGDMSKVRQEWLDAQIMARELLMLLDKALNGLEHSTTSLREARLFIQESDLVVKEARLTMQEGNRELEKYVKLLQKLKGKTPEDKTHDPPHVSPGHELTAGAEADGEGDN
jgi:hypothetical protein